MHVTKLELIRIQGKSIFKHGNFAPLIVRIHTNEGLYGLGEIALSIGQSQNAVCGAVRDFAPFIIGKDPFNIESVWSQMHRNSLWAQGGGCAIFGAISGIDSALWDLKAKALGVGLFQLLGGATRSKIPSYASQLQFGWGDGSVKICNTPELLVHEAHAAKQDGYTCIKFDPIGYDENGNWASQSLRGPLPRKVINAAEQSVAAIRNALPDLDIIIELHCLTDTASAIQLMQILAPYGILFFEEPTSPLNPALMNIIKQQTNLPLAAGEKLYTRWRFSELIHMRSLDVIQPDIGVCGGVTECKKIADMAEPYDIHVQLHCCQSPISVAFALHLECAIPNFLIHETHRNVIIEENIALGTQDIRPVKGHYSIPQGTGIGQDLSEYALSRADIVAM